MTSSFQDIFASLHLAPVNKKDRQIVTKSCQHNSSSTTERVQMKLCGYVSQDTYLCTIYLVFAELLLNSSIYPSFFNFASKISLVHFDKRFQFLYVVTYSIELKLISCRPSSLKFSYYSRFFFLQAQLFSTELIELKIYFSYYFSTVQWIQLKFSGYFTNLVIAELLLAS